jgi:hypothetical protein
MIVPLVLALLLLLSVGVAGVSPRFAQNNAGFRQFSL